MPFRVPSGYQQKKHAAPEEHPGEATMAGLLLPLEPALPFDTPHAQPQASKAISAEHPGEATVTGLLRPIERALPFNPPSERATVRQTATAEHPGEATLTGAMPSTLPTLPFNSPRIQLQVSPLTASEHPGEATLAGSLPPLEAALPFTPPSSHAPVPTSKAPSFPLPQSSVLPSMPRITLEQYAWLCAELAVFSRSADQVFAKYGLHALQERLTTDLAWQEQLRRDPSAFRRWQAYYHQAHAHCLEAARRQRR
jgi:hypothetical protein